jgi:hypothetical protein
MENTGNYLGRCKDCDYVIFATAEDVQQADGFRDVTAGTGVYRINDNVFARCTNRHKVFLCKPVQGTYSADHQCDSRCLNARGWKCTCSCGGANHGRGHVAMITQAASLTPSTTVVPEHQTRPHEPGYLDMIAQAVVRENPALAPAPALRHLGVVGEHITGKVFVKTRKSLANGSILFSMRAVNGGHVIKWFAPGYADPGFEVGSIYKIRAKVKSHGEFNGMPETIVTHVEEVE